MADPGRDLKGMLNQPFLAPNNEVFNQEKHISIFYNVAPHLTSYRFLTYSSRVWHDLVVTKTAISSTPLEGNQIVFIVSLYLYRFCSCKGILMFLFFRRLVPSRLLHLINYLFYVLENVSPKCYNFSIS